MGKGTAKATDLAMEMAATGQSGLRSGSKGEDRKQKAAGRGRQVEGWLRKPTLK
jgi:hypothetical protein